MPERKIRCIDYGEDGDSTIIIECSKEKAKELRAEKDRRIYFQRQQKKSGYMTFSYSSFCSEEGEVSGEELMTDMRCDIESEFIHRLKMNNLHSCMKVLPEIEMSSPLSFIFITGDDNF